MPGKLKAEKNVEIADENCFVGFDSYQKVIDSGVDFVLLCTPPHFRPAHVEAAVNARKHIFMEKPIAVDPVGARSVMASAKKAEAIGLMHGKWHHPAGSERLYGNLSGGLQMAKLAKLSEQILFVTAERFGIETVSRNGPIWNTCCETG